MSRKSTKRGMVIPLSLIAILAVLGLVTTMGSLNQGLRTQIYRTNNHQLSFFIAYSAFSRVCAKIHSFSWASRPFLNEPYTETKTPLQGGHYDLLVENTAGKDYQADIYIRSHLAGISRMYFWRIRFNNDLLDISNNIIVELYAAPDVDDYPTVGGPRTIAGKVEDMLTQRTINQKKSDQLASELMKITNEKSVLEKIGARVPDDFQQEWPISVTEEIMEAKVPVNPPDLPLPLAAEKPSASGPGASPNTGGNSGTSVNPNTGADSGGTAFVPGSTPTSSTIPYSNDSMTGNQISELSAKLTAASEKLVESTDKAWTEVEVNGSAGIPAATEQWTSAAESKGETYSTLDDLISETRRGIAEAPSAQAQAAIESMVAQTVVSSMNNMTVAIERGFEHVVVGAEGHLAALTAPAAVESLISDWKAAEEITQGDLDKLTAMASKIQGYAMVPEVSQKLATTLASVEKSLKTIQDAVVAAEARLAELQALEAQADADAAAAADVASKEAKEAAKEAAAVEAAAGAAGAAGRPERLPQ